MNRPHEIYKKYQKGSPLTDDEIREGMEFFKDVSDKLYQAGPVFILPAIECNRVYLGLNGYYTARKMK